MYPGRADMLCPSVIDRLVPQADICGAANEALFDHLVGAGEQGRRQKAGRPALVQKQKLRVVNR
jgi:hypothetical protein